MPTKSESASYLTDDHVTLVHIIRALRSRIKLIVITVICFATLSTVLAFILTPVYEGKITIVEATGNDNRARTSTIASQLGGFGSLMGIDLSAFGDSTPSGITVLESRTLLEEFIRRNGLMTTVLAEYWNADLESWDASLEREPELWEAAEYLMDYVIIETDKDSPNLLKVRVRWIDPELASSWANGIVALANELTRQRDINSSEKSIEFLNSQIEKTQVIKLEEVLYSLLQSELEVLTLANAQQEYAFRVIDPAFAPIEPVSPVILEVIAVGTFIGLVFSIFLVFMLKVIDELRAQDAIMQSKDQ